MNGPVHSRMSRIRDTKRNPVRYSLEVVVASFAITRSDCICRFGFRTSNPFVAVDIREDIA